jgi:MFS family permease
MRWMPSERSVVASPTSRRYAVLVLALLVLANVFAVADRGIMGILLEPMKRELAVSDAAMSLLTGAAFVLFYSLFGIPIARWCDVGNRRIILAAGIAVWSFMTAMCGAAANLGQMALARAGLGIGEATVNPASMSLIADYFGERGRIRAIAVFNMGLAIAAIAVVPAAAIVADHYGWRAAFYVLAAPGLVLAVVIRFVVAEPVRGRMDQIDPLPGSNALSLGDAFRTMWSSRPFVLILLGTTVTGLGAWTLGAWGPALMMRAYGVSASQVAAVYGPISAVAGIAGGLGGGFLTGWVAARRRSQRWNLLLPALVSVATVPAGVLFALAPSFPLMALGGAVGAGTIAFRMAPHMAISLELVPPNCRGLAATVNVIAFSVVGQALGPLAVGILSDYLAPMVGTTMSLRYGMIVAPVTLALGAIPFFLAVGCFDDDGVRPEHSGKDRTPAVTE